MSSAPDTPRVIDFQTAPDRYHHWTLECDGAVAWLGLRVDEQATLGEGYELKLNSYDLGVDIELYDAVQRLRFEHPEVGCVVVHSKHERVFCAGANIRMLGRATHAHKVNFCKFTNETRNGIEDATDNSRQVYLAAVKGSCAGGGYELALACDEIILADDGASAVSLPEVPLLAVLPGTGGLTRLVDKRLVRRDRADFFCTIEEGIRGKRAVDWRLVDRVVPSSAFDEAVAARAAELAAASDRPRSARGVALAPLARRIDGDRVTYDNLEVHIDRQARAATLVVKGPLDDLPGDIEAILAAGARFWPLALMRELDDAILHLRFNEEEIGTWMFKSEGDGERVLAADALLEAHAEHWFVREVQLYAQRVLKRLDVSARTLIAAVEPGSCFAGSLLELVLAADQSFMLAGQFEDDERPPATVALSPANFGRLRMVNGLTRLEARSLDEPAAVERLRARVGEALEAEAAEALGLVTFIPDDIDWEDEIRILVEARAGFSPDALTGMEASLRFPGPETMESKIFSRLSAWQNWIFQRPNAVGDQGALVLYGSGERPQFNKHRV
ncbi:MAG: benzoyl-CoA-dihydrodiol lyase [Gammaproteobacteria bacterium]|nr:benzoyl-CoA-dihydrodiol lyase [Gammaproteobacteria bacterium]MCP5199478.1 benzoyl-CoA-dihydrodiol lyase [Gammaproteobacteria bacterium]